MKKNFNLCGHYVVKEEEYLADIHTHNLRDELHHLEFQIVLKIRKELAYNIFNSVINEYVLKEISINDGDLLYNIIENYPLKIFKTKDSFDEEIFRILLPDPNGLFPEDINCEFPYNLQKQPIEN